MTRFKWPLIIGIALLAWACGGSQQSAPADTAGEVAETTSTATTFAVDPAASEVAWIGNKHIGDSHNGTLAVSAGSLSVEGGQLTAGTFTIDVANGLKVLDIEDAEKNGQLTGHLKSEDFFSAEAHPEATFAITKVEALTGQADASHQISGNLTIKGISHEITFPAMVQVSESQISAEAATSIDRTKWDIMFHSGLEAWGDKTILDEIPLTLKLVANAAGDGVAAAE